MYLICEEKETDSCSGDISPLKNMSPPEMVACPILGLSLLKLKKKYPSDMGCHALKETFLFYTS